MTDQRTDLDEDGLEPERTWRSAGTATGDRAWLEALPHMGLPHARHGVTTHETLGGLAVFASRLYLLMAPTLILNALVGPNMPANITFTLPALGVVLIAPRRLLLKMPVSPAVVILLVWLCLSYMWSVEPVTTLFNLREDLVPVVGLLFVLALLPVEESIRWLVRGFKLVLLLSLVVTIVDPGSRVSDFEGQELAAWEAWFGSKNQLGRSAMMAFLVLLTLDKTKVSRLLGIAAAVILVIGSSSATALAGMVFVLAIWLWARQFQRVEQERSATYVMASIAGGILGVIVLVASAAWVVGLLGRDLSFSGRNDLWQPSLDFIAERPWHGYGYRSLFTPDSPESIDLWREIGFPAAHAHNGPLELTLGVGVVGLVMFLVVWFSTFAASLRTLRRSDLAVFCFAFLLVQQLVAFVEPVYIGDWLGILVIARMLLLHQRLNERAERLELMQRVRGRSAMTLGDYSALEATRGRGRRGI